jgi:hypothetical protein
MGLVSDVALGFLACFGLRTSRPPLFFDTGTS